MDRVRLAEGKTKIVWQDETDPSTVIIESKDDITAGDGAKHDVMTGKGIDATETTCNVFSLLRSCGELTAFRERVGERAFWADRCAMVPYEVVVRREARGSILKRHPDLKAGDVFRRPRIEFYLKTSRRQWEGLEIPKDDPLVVFDGWTGPKVGKALLFRPDTPLAGQKPFLELDAFPMRHDRDEFDCVCCSAARTFLILEKSWNLLGYRLADIKVEFGLASWGAAVLADVIDNDSWRVLRGSEHLDKQVYRDGASLALVASKYDEARILTGLFRLPRQCITVWLPSCDKDIDPFLRAYERHSGRGNCGDVMMNLVRSSFTADCGPVYALFRDLISDGMDRVIVYGGDPDGQAAQSIARHSPFPVVFASIGARPVRTDGGDPCPALYAQNPEDAVLGALRILAERNPRLWADFRLAQDGYDVTSVR